MNDDLWYVLRNLPFVLAAIVIGWTVLILLFAGGS